MDIQKFLNVEEQYALNDKQIEGVNYWTYDRFRLWNYDICSNKLGLAEAHDKKRLNVSGVVKLLKSFLKSTLNCGIHDVLVLSHPRKVFNGEQYECLYTNAVVDKFFDSIFIEQPFEFEHLEPTFSNNVLFNDRIIISSGLYVALYKIIQSRKYKVIKQKIKSDTENALLEIKNEYGWEGNIEAEISRLANIVIRTSYEKKIYRRIVDKVKPKVILEVVYYSRKNMIINELAYERGIPTLELQHGTLYKEHAAYQFLSEKAIKQLPQKMLLFSDYWKDYINVPIKEDNLVVAGFPYFENKVKQYEGYERKDKRITLLFISQGTIGKYLSELACEIRSELPEQDYRIIYKLHPAEYSTWKSEMSLLDQEGIDVIDNNEISLYECFANSDYQIGAYSTALFEGMGFGISTLIYNVGHYDIMLPLVEKGYAKLVTNAKEVGVIVRDKDVRVQMPEFWALNAMQKIRNEIKKCL